MNLLYWTVLWPLLGFVVLACTRGRLAENAAAAVGVGSLMLSAATAAWVGTEFLATVPTGGSWTQVLWTWFSVDGFEPRVAFRLDGLSLTLLGVITGVGALIHLFASWYMRGEEGYSRFFAYMNLFVACMVVLVLADNLVLLYLGWEGVGLCSYLLIGFYYRETANGNAARKAFIVTRIGDVFLAFALFMLYREAGTLDIEALSARVPELFVAGSVTVNAVALLLLGGAAGKSAQLPLQTWLADAMAGPTPVSALIHAATMVTAGVYLIARMNGVFLLAPGVLQLVGIVGAVTLLVAGCSALVQTDIKRILAYSTMSQLGYMFLALGAGAWHAAIFHLVTHAFFKALLFLSAGAVILACHHEQHIFRMGGLRRALPMVYAAFLIGGGALAALPLVTAGFFSKDAILWEAWAGQHTSLVAAGWVGAILTSLYTFRLVYVVFHGPERNDVHAGHGVAHGLPLLVLMVLSTAVGAFIPLPLEGVLPLGPGHAGGDEKHWVEVVSAVIALGGIAVGVVMFRGEGVLARRLGATGVGRALSALWRDAWGFDRLYDALCVHPFLWLSRELAPDWVDRLAHVPVMLARAGAALSSGLQTGHIRAYAAGLAAATLLVLCITML